MSFAFLDRAGAWFLDSGIQAESGGVARYYLADRDENRPVSTEITGYAISTLLYLHKLSPNEDYLKAAVHAARFLTRSAWDPAGQVFPFEHFDAASRNGHEPLAYFFDSGIIVRGLLSLWRATHDSEYLRVAIACSRAMVSRFEDGLGDFHPIVRLSDNAPLVREPLWSRCSGCYQLKSALAFYEVGEVSNDRLLQQQYWNLLERSLDSHQEFLPGTDDEFRVMDRLHAYAYFLEGLLPAVDDKRCGEALETGFQSIAAHLDKIGPRFARSDAYAQLLRMRLYADAHGLVRLDREAAACEAASVARFQITDPNVRLDGGFYFGQREGKWIPHVNPVSTGFGLQALAMWELYQRDQLEPIATDLI